MNSNSVTNIIDIVIRINNTHNEYDKKQLIDTLLAQINFNAIDIICRYPHERVKLLYPYYFILDTIDFILSDNKPDINQSSRNERDILTSCHPDRYSLCAYYMRILELFKTPIRHKKIAMLDIGTDQMDLIMEYKYQIDRVGELLQENMQLKSALEAMDYQNKTMKLYSEL